MKRGDLTFNSVVILDNGRKGFVTGIMYSGDDIVSVAVRCPQGRPQLYLPSEVEVVRI